jgi:predicted PurR-regulated permease PerM
MLGPESETSSALDGMRRLFPAAMAVLLVAFVLWELAAVLLLVAAAILFAIFLDGLARGLASRIPLGRRGCLALVGVTLVAAVAGIGLYAGPRITAQLAAFLESLREAASAVLDQIRNDALGQRFLSALPEDPGRVFMGGETVKRAVGAADRAFSSVTNAALVVLIGGYLALRPQLYVAGLGKLIPPRHRRRVQEVLAAMGRVLRRWLVGRVASMTVVGLLTGIGLFVLGVPAAASLALIAALLSFIPFLGPAVSYVPAALIALADGGALLLLWVTIVYASVQALESSVITPQIEKVAVSLPPALLICVQLAFGTLGGLSGVIMATPLTVAIVVLVERLYVEDLLGDDVAPLADGT